MRNYLKIVDGKLQSELSEDEKKRLKEDLLIQIMFFQHERLIHALVTLTFAILTVATLFVVIIFENISVFVFVFLFLLLTLLVPYIRHYFILERGVQKLYEYYDKLI